MELPYPSGHPRNTSRDRGIAAEQTARAFLEQQGFVLITANYHCRFGEIDLVMRRKNLLVFAEVRVRNHRDFGGAAASVTLRKQQKIIATANAFLHHRPEFAQLGCRFDVIALQSLAEGWQVEWLPDAFTT